MNKEIVWESLKEPLRLAVLAIIPLLVTYFTELGTEWALIAILVLRFVDKLLHETGKALEENKTVESILTGGLTRF